MRPPAPTSVAQLKERARNIAGKTLRELADQYGEQVPVDLLHAKGWIGQLIEKALGANAFNLDQPDFMALGIELKTLPINTQGQPSESTYICTAPIPPQDSRWEDSRVWRKIAQVLWVPISADKSQPVAAQQIGTPLLWSPSAEIAQQLRQDWEELTELMALGQFENLSAQRGKYLQIRPKAPNAKTFIQVVNDCGQVISLVPKGFYLRSTLTQQILQQHYVHF